MEHYQDGSFMMSQPLLIGRIIDAIPGMNMENSVTTPFASGTLLDKDKNGAPQEENWNYQSLVGILNYLVNSKRPELAFTMN